MSTLLKKMNLKGLGCEPKMVRDSKYAPDKNIQLAVIYGRASGTKSGENRSGNSEIWTALTGSFEGVNKQEGTPEYGKMFNSGIVFLPGGSQELIEGALSNAGDGSVVEFAFEIFSRHDVSSPVGYRYQIANLKPPAPTDDLATLRQLTGVTALLGLPETTAPAPVQVAPAPAPAPVQAAPAPAPAPKPKK